jgi:hypothetical protein
MTARSGDMGFPLPEGSGLVAGPPNVWVANSAAHFLTVSSCVT